MTKAGFAVPCIAIPNYLQNVVVIDSIL